MVHGNPFKASVVSQEGGVFYIPAGLYLIKGRVSFTEQGPDVTLRGDGWNSIVLWASDADLFTFDQDQPTEGVTLTSIAIASTGPAKSSASTAFNFAAGFVRGLITDLAFVGAGSWPGVPSTSYLGTCLDLGNVGNPLMCT
jgi:hypothetical protein